MKELIISCLLTLLLGPGVGHIVLKEFKKAWILIGLTLLSALLFALNAIRSLTPDQLTAIQKDPAAFARSFTMGSASQTWWFDVIFAALWSYALMDCYFICRRRMASTPKEGPE